jgi:Serine/threonine protein phosphatase
MTTDTAQISETGGRDVNQDDCLWHQDEDTGIWIVADGLGGHRGGEVASTLAAEAVRDAFEARPSLEGDRIGGHIETAHQTILEQQDERPELSTMRTTIVALFRCGAEVRWAHVGDARLYHFRGGGVRFQTKDHSLPQTEVAAGNISPDEIRFHPDRERLLRAMGQEGDVRPDVASEITPLEEGDAFLLCTDGFWEYVIETQMEVALAKSASAADWLDRMEQVLRSRAEGTHDNYSALGLIVE